MPERKNTRKLNPRPVGTEPGAEQMPPQVGDEELDTTAADTGKDQAAQDEQITVSKSDLQAMIDAAVEQKVEAQVVDAVKQARRKAELSRKVDDRANLPDQSEVDPDKIERAVLTKQGYVCPTVHPTDRKRLENSNLK